MAARAKRGLRGGSLRRHCPDQVLGGRRSASELSPASQPFLPAPGLPGTPFGPAPSITSQMFRLHDANDGRLGPKVPGLQGQTSWLRRKVKAASRPRYPASLYGRRSRPLAQTAAPHSPVSGGSSAASRDRGVHASWAPPARSFTGGRPYPACRESNDWRHDHRRSPGPGRRRTVIVVKGVANPACPATGPGRFLLQPYSSGGGRVRVKSSSRAGGLLAGVAPFVVRRFGSVRECGRDGWWRAARDAGRFVGSEPVFTAWRWDLTRGSLSAAVSALVRLRLA